VLSWVDLPVGLDWAASEFPRHAELISLSTGWNLATIHLGNGWKPWTQPRTAALEQSFGLARGSIQTMLVTPLPGRSQGRASALEESPDTIGQRAL